MRTEINPMVDKINKEIDDLSNKLFLENKKADEFDINFDVKHILEDMKSVLDYMAADIHKKYCANHKSKKIYFQYSKEGETEQNFISQMNKNFPGVYDSHNNLYKILAKEQCFYDNSNWLIKLHELVRTVKHNDLYVATVKKEKNTLITSDKTSMLIKGDIIVKKEGNRCGFYAPGSITINGTGRAAFYCDGTVVIDDGKYDMKNSEVQNLNKDVYYETIIKSKKYDEDIMPLLVMILGKIRSLVAKLEIYI